MNNKINEKKIIKIANLLFNNGKFEEIISFLTDKLIHSKKNNKKLYGELYLRRGVAWHNKNCYDKAIFDYDKAIEINSGNSLALYNRGLAKIKKENYSSAISDYNKAIKIDPYFSYAYVIRASILSFLKKYKYAIRDYDKAIKINPEFANAYYNRGLTKKETLNDMKGSRQDFEKYLKLTFDEHDIWAKYANYYIEYIDDLIDNDELRAIVDLINKIKKILLFEDNLITHYTSLSALSYLVLNNSQFRISEGNFMNDPSEGKILFEYLHHKPIIYSNNEFLSEKFLRKPFIGSFVTDDKFNNLNMWRFYGKEGGVEAKGCAITITAQEFINDINTSIPTKNCDILKYESDIYFYRIAYLMTGQNNFYIPNSDKQDMLSQLMKELKCKVSEYSTEDKTSLEKHMNSIAFLFKSDAYKDENEVRMVVNGLGFDKKYNTNTIPQRVYIELESIKKMIKKITLGPKVDKPNEWAAVIHYSYDVNPPEILISRIPYR